MQWQQGMPFAAYPNRHLHAANGVKSGWSLGRCKRFIALGDIGH